MTYCDSDIISINETHLKDNKQTELDGYKWEGQNRSKQHVWARKGFGGVGVFVKSSLYESYIVSIEYKEYDDMIGILFTNKSTNYCFMVYSLYLPPETSVVYNNAPNFLRVFCWRFTNGLSMH